jgi:hypothetical protein
VLLDNKAWSDSQDPMSLCQSIARKAFADFFAATEVQHAHWYQVKEATVGCRINEINNAFPSLSKLLSIPEELLMAVEEAAGLVSVRRGVFSPKKLAWEALIAEYRLNNEITSFRCGDRVRIFVKVGSWSHRHPGITPESIWATKGAYRRPMLRISRLTMAFAAGIGNLDCRLPTSSARALVVAMVVLVTPMTTMLVKYMLLIFLVPPSSYPKMNFLCCIHLAYRMSPN